MNDTQKQMHSKCIGVLPVGKPGSHKSWRRVLCVLILAAAPLGGQTPGRLDGQNNPLPKSTGEPVTIAPVDLQDIECSIQEWNPVGPKPFLKLLCPPQAEFAPVRVYLKLSWLNADDIPIDLARIIARPLRATKIRTSKSAVMVRLEVAVDSGEGAQEKWVGFNGLVDVALMTDPRHP